MTVARTIGLSIGYTTLGLVCIGMGMEAGKFIGWWWSSHRA